MTATLDFAFPVAGDVIELDHAAALYRAVVAVLPWLDDEPLAGVHPVRGLTPSSVGMLVGGRTRIVLRVPEHRAEACAALEGADLRMPGLLHVGCARRRELLAYPVLHSRLVVTGAQDEPQFLRDVGAGVAELGIDCETIVGRRGELMAGPQQRWVGYSLMLHGLSAEHSLRAQERGLGLHRKLGCGLFVPHKSIAAVGL